MPKNTRGVQVKQIAEHLGLSSGTVSIVLNGRGDELRISRETQKIVMDTAREMNYQPGKNQKKNQKTVRKSDGFRIGVFWNLHYMGGPFRPVLFRISGDGKAVSDKSGNRSSAL